MTEAPNTNGMPFWPAARTYVHRSLAAPRTHIDPSKSEPGIDLDWWKLARDRYKSALFFCSPLTDTLTGRPIDINRRATELVQQHKLESAYVPKQQTLTQAIKAEEGVSLHFLVKLNMALEAIVEHQSYDIDDYKAALQAMQADAIIPAFHVLNWQVLSEYRTKLNATDLDAFSDAIFKDENRISGQKKRAVLGQLSNGYAMGASQTRKGTLSVTYPLAESMTNGIEKLLGEKPANIDMLFQMTPDYNTRALSTALGNVAS